MSFTTSTISFLLLRSSHLVRRVVKRSEVRMQQRLLHRDALLRVECQHALAQLEGNGVGVGEVVREGDLGALVQRANVLFGLLKGKKGLKVKK